MPKESKQQTLFITDMPEYMSPNHPWWSRVPDRFKDRFAPFEERQGWRKTIPLTAIEWLGHAGFPAKITTSKLMDHPFREPIISEHLNHNNAESWLPKFLLLHGPHRAGKTTLVANKLYWYGYMWLARAHELLVRRYDTQQAIRVLLRARSTSLTRAVDEELAGEQDTGYLYENLADLRSFRGLVVLDDCNTDLLQKPGAAELLTEVVLTRYQNLQPVWLITNDTVEETNKAFTRLRSRLMGDTESWTVVHMPAREAVQTAVE